MCILYACTTYIYIYTYIHACVSIMCHQQTQTMCIMYIYIYILCYPHPKKLYSSPPKPTIYIYIYIYIHDHDYICQRARFPQLPLLCFLVMLPVEQPLLTNGCSPTLGLLLMTSSFPCSTSYISSCIIYIYIYLKEESIGTTIYLCACFITFWKDHLRGSSS